MASKPSRSRFQAHQSSQRVADARSFSLERTCIRTHSCEARLSPGTRFSTYTTTPCPAIGVGRNSERFPLESFLVGPMTVAALGNGAACCETTKVMEVDTFAPENIFAEIKKFKPEFEMEYDVDPLKQAIADSWPDRLDDSAARSEWDWQPQYDITAMTKDMLEQLSKRLLK